ncbi:CLEC4G [Cervus elaphus hippelaphus]|uniref:CLEC4G n=1 Tax=Cervus elaphus hippelaphus TaxID=46360 RepID=A0A212D0P8_CEREH|nr:CLEC4G [Cervus elaphus hippelaphus]
MVITVLWTLILSVLFSKASTERGALLDHQGLLSTNVSKQTAVLGILKEEVRACNSCCLGTQAQLQTVSKELGEARSKLLQQESALKELSERVTQSLAEAGRDRENIRTELFRALEQARLGNSSCKECPESWLPFQGSCYFFSTLRATWVEAQQHCERSGAHLVIVGGLEEQVRSPGCLRAGRGRSLPEGRGLAHWNRGEPNDSMGREDCIMMLRTGLWNDAPCDNENDNWICEKRLSC